MPQQAQRKDDYEKLGKMLVSIGELGYKNKKELYKMSFVKGILSGIGGVFGVTIVVGLILYVLTLFGHIPYIGFIAEEIMSSIDESTRN